MMEENRKWYISLRVPPIERQHDMVTPPLPYAQLHIAFVPSYALSTELLARSSCIVSNYKVLKSNIRHLRFRNV